jgi:hypothetical protein
MGRRVVLFTCLVLLAGSGVMGQQPLGISRPPRGLSWQIKDKETHTVYHVIPLQSIDAKAHDRCRELVGGNSKVPGNGFLFFVVIIDNSRGKEPVEFSAFGGDGVLYYQPDPSPKAPTNRPDSEKYGFVSLKNHFLDPGNAPRDKAAYKLVQGYFKTDLKVAVGAIGWSLACIRDSFIFDPKRNAAMWMLPGRPEYMKAKRYSRSLVSKAGVQLFP